jgi:hypothetical protein
MKKREVISYVCFGAFMAALIPLDLSATTSFDTTAITNMHEQGSKIQDFIFGVPLRVVGILGIGYAALHGVLTGTPTKVYGYGGMGLASLALPYFVNAIFPVTKEVSSMLLP